MAFAWTKDEGTERTPPQSHRQPNTDEPPTPTGPAVAAPGGDDGHYGPGHPWHYLPQGDNAPPVPVDAIPAAENLAHTFDRELPKPRAKRLVKARELLDAERRGLEDDCKRYQEIIERGADALSQYDREIAHGGDLELARASALALKHNHIAWRKGRIAVLERELSPSVARWR